MASTKFKQACAAAIERNPKKKFARSCAKRYPELVGGEPRPRVSKKIPQECKDGLSEDMKAGRKKTAFKKYWACRREHGAA